MNKHEVHPRTGYEGPEWEQSYSSTLSLTSELDGSGCLTPRPGHFTPRKEPVPIVQEAGWTPGPVWTGVQNLASNRDSIPGPSRLQRVAIPTELSLLTINIMLVLILFLTDDTSNVLGHYRLLPGNFVHCAGFIDSGLGKKIRIKNRVEMRSQLLLIASPSLFP